MKKVNDMSNKENIANVSKDLKIEKEQEKNLKYERNLKSQNDSEENKNENKDKNKLNSNLELTKIATAATKSETLKNKNLENNKKETEITKQSTSEKSTPSYEFHINSPRLNKDKKHKNNRINTTKYGLITFLPKALLFQFMRLANVYFLIIAIIQCIPSISPLSPSTAIAPISFVLCVSLIREGLEDLARYTYDKAANNEKVRVYRDGHWTETISANLQIGEIVVISEDKAFPADLILLDSSVKEGICYIETATLDGEKTLKFKKAHQRVADKFKCRKETKEFLGEFGLSGYCICDRPNESLFQLNGSIKVDFENLNDKKLKSNINAINVFKNNNEKNENLNDKANSDNTRARELIEKNRQFLKNYESENEKKNNEEEENKNNKIFVNTEMENLNGKNNYNSNNENNNKINVLNNYNKLKENFSGENSAEQPKNEEGFSQDFVIPLKNESMALDPKQLLLKGAILKNTEWIIGIIVYTGHNTKLMLNSKKAKVKYSSVEKLMTKFLIAVLILQSIFCIIAAVLYGVYYKANIEFNPFLNTFTKNLLVASVLNYFTYLLLLNTMIPISLIITLEITKIIQGYFISLDVKLFSKIRRKFCKAGSVSLNEELGIVDYIFSDKTGTLTCNKMKFKYCVAADVCYEFIREEDFNKFKAENEKNLSKKEKDDYEKEKFFRDENQIKCIYDNHLINLKNHFNNNQNTNNDTSNNKHGNIEKNLLSKSHYPNFILNSNQEFGKVVSLALDDNLKIEEEFFKALALNSECVISNKKGFNEYSGMNPDDIELVTASKMLGCELLKSESTRLKHLKLYNTTKTFEILNVIEFTSKRKKSSIFVREDNQIKMYIKGADSEMLPIISDKSPKEFTEQARNFVDLFSKQGYRTLLVAMRIFSEAEYSALAQELTEVRLSVAENKETLLEIIEKKIEKDVYCLGATIVEDKLQESVPETIRDLRLAGIKVWMLTGDKIDTAENIGKSCNLISSELQIFKITNQPGFFFSDLVKKFDEYLLRNGVSYEDYEKAHVAKEDRILPEYCVMIDLKETATDFAKEKWQQEFVRISKYAKSVICSRCSPNEKSKVVKMIKESDSKLVTLSIGDGGNDVPMITEAHIGIGVYGEEGVMAVQSSDFAIGEFHFLRRLLLFHGRTNYVRITEMILYFFFKNFVFTITHFYFGFYNNFSGQTIIDDWFISLYNMIFTAFPLGARAVADHDIHPQDGKAALLFQPFLYEENKRNPIFNIKSFVLEVLRGMLHGLINYFILYFVLLTTPVDSDGNTADMWFFSVNCYTNIIFIVSLNLLIKSRYITVLNFLTMLILSWILYFAFVLWVHFTTFFNSNSTMFVAFTSSSLYLTWVLIMTLTAGIDYFFYSFDVNFFKSTINILMRERKIKGSIDKFHDLPRKLDRYINKLKQFEDDGASSIPTNLNKIVENLGAEVIQVEIGDSKNNKNKDDNNKDSVRQDLKGFQNPDDDEAEFNNRVNMRKI